MKRRKRKTKPKKMSYEYIPSPDGEERLNRVYDMLFDKIDPFDPSTAFSTQGPFGLSSGSKTILSEPKY